MDWYKLLIHQIWFWFHGRVRPIIRQPDEANLFPQVCRVMLWLSPFEERFPHRRRRFQTQGALQKRGTTRIRGLPLDYCEHLAAELEKNSYPLENGKSPSWWTSNVDLTGHFRHTFGITRDWNDLEIALVVNPRIDKGHLHLCGEAAGGSLQVDNWWFGFVVWNSKQ